MQISVDFCCEVLNAKIVTPDEAEVESVYCRCIGNKKKMRRKALIAGIGVLLFSNVFWAYDIDLSTLPGDIEEAEQQFHSEISADNRLALCLKKERMKKEMPYPS